MLYTAIVFLLFYYFIIIDLVFNAFYVHKDIA